MLQSWWVQHTTIWVIYFLHLIFLAVSLILNTLSNVSYCFFFFLFFFLSFFVFVFCFFCFSFFFLFFSFVTMPHFMLLNNWHVTYAALLKGFELSIVNGNAAIFGKTVTQGRARLIARMVVALWTFSYFIIMIIIILNILISK